MAKFTRFDPRNKKRGRHKHQSLHKDLRIKNSHKSEKSPLLSPQTVVVYSYNEGEKNEVKQLKSSNSY
jgi:hypothetical protein